MTTYLEEVLTFFLWVGGTYAVGAAVAIYVYFKTGAVTYESGRSAALRRDPRAAHFWYMSLHKASFTPGTVAYGLAWALGYLCFGYSVWRVWIAPVARESDYGIGIAAVAIVHWASLGGAAWLVFGTENLVLGTLGHFLNLATSATITGLIWKLHAAGTAALIGAGVAASLYTFVHMLALAVHISLLVKNSCGRRTMSQQI